MPVKQKILEYLLDYHRGAENAIMGRRLCSVFGISFSLLHQAIGELQADGYPVCSSLNGYFYALTPEEVDHTIAHLTSRIQEMGLAKDGLVLARDHFCDTSMLEDHQ